ncbi:MAG: CBS domain-containing protein [Caldilineaceae bacterium]
MLIADCMTRHPILIPPTMSASEAQKILSENHIRHLPVVESGKRLAGLITRQQLLLKADAVGSLNVWEISRYLADLKVAQVMVKGREVTTITADRTIERASLIMAERKIGCMPVVEDNTVVVGIVTETDLLRSFQEMLGLPSPGVRVTVRMPDREGEFARLIAVLAAHHWGVMGVGTLPSRRHPGFYDAVLKIPDVTIDQVRDTLSTIPDQEVVDVRTAV